MSIFRTAYLMMIFAVTVGPNMTQSTYAQSESSGIRIQKGISYLPDAAQTDEYAKATCRLDLYLPAQPTTGFPLLVWFHGGGLNGGSRDGYVEVAKRFAEQGVAVANVDYRLNPRVKFPVYVEDAALSVAWATKEGVKLGANPKGIFVGGHSAGGYLAAILAMDEKYLRGAGVSPGSLAGVLPVSGQLITHSMIRAERGLSRSNVLSDDAAPLFHVREDAPPMLLLVADKDMPARVEETKLFVSAMTHIAKNKTTSMLVVADRNHGSISDQILTPNDEAGPAMLEFIKKWTKASSPQQP